MTDESPRGLWGLAAEVGEPRNELAACLIDELDAGLQILADMPAAVTFFGGARIDDDDAYYADAEKMGELLADHNIPPRTGAGPGIMRAVPEGFRNRANDADNGDCPALQRQIGEGAQPLTQGFNIILPFEQSVNPAIDLSMELAHFPTRKLMLYQNALGLVIFPGGFGTVDELIEVWRLKAAGDLDFPVLLYGNDFWKPFEQALQTGYRAYPHLALEDDRYELLECTDDLSHTIERVTEADLARQHAEPLHQLGRRIARELVDGLNFLEQLTPAVTVLGGSRVSPDSELVAMAEQLACELGRHDVPTRAAAPGELSVALARGGHRGQKHLPQQAFGIRREHARNVYGADRVHLVADRLTHKVLLNENSRALVAFPGGLGTLDEFFSMLCQLQTGTIARRQVVLMGTEFWQPILDTVRTQMLDGPRQTIAAEDMDLMVVTDDPKEAADAALADVDELPPVTHRN